jgi:hypothetical protein
VHWLMGTTGSRCRCPPRPGSTSGTHPHRCGPRWSRSHQPKPIGCTARPTPAHSSNTGEGRSLPRPEERVGVLRPVRPLGQAASRGSLLTPNQQVRVGLARDVALEAAQDLFLRACCRSMCASSLVPLWMRWSRRFGCCCRNSGYALDGGPATGRVDAWQDDHLRPEEPLWWLWSVSGGLAARAALVVVVCFAGGVWFAVEARLWPCCAVWPLGVPGSGRAGRTRVWCPRWRAGVAGPAAPCGGLWVVMGVSRGALPGRPGRPRPARQSLKRRKIQ